MNKLFAGSALLVLANAQGRLFEKMRDMAEKSGCERKPKSEIESLLSLVKIKICHMHMNFMAVFSNEIFCQLSIKRYMYAYTCLSF